VSAVRSPNEDDRSRMPQPLTLRPLLPSGIHFVSAPAIRVKRAPKPDPAKRRPPTADRPPLLFQRACHAFRSIYSSHPRFVSSPSAAPTAPLGSACLASLGCPLCHLDLDEPQPLAHTLPSNRPGANDDADDDVQCWLRPSGPRNPSVQCTQGCLGTTSLPSSRRLHLPSQRQRELGTGAGLSRDG
jgi:hypothetical protein